MTAKRCYFIGNTHIDHTWLWHWTEGYDEVHASFRSALERMEEFPEFVFTCSSTLHYAWVETGDPEMFAEIRRRVAEGRWQLAGGWLVQSDNNIPCGEAFVRQGLYGQGYFESRFGRRAHVGYCVDSFGHHAQLPQILKQQGLDGWLHFRPRPGELDLPNGPYRWTGIDGSEVVAIRPPGWYGWPGNERDDEFKRAKLEAVSTFFGTYPEVLFFFGVGDHGGGPTIRDLEFTKAFTHDNPGVEAIYGELDRFFERAECRRNELPLVTGELQHCFRGCYTTDSRVKALNRQAEARLISAEKAATLAAMVLDLPVPSATLRRAWDGLLMNHFHDVVSGTSTRHAMDEAVYRYGSTLDAAESTRHIAVKRLTSLFDRTPPGACETSIPVCVANLLSWGRTEPVEIHPFVPGRDMTSPTLVDADGVRVECQAIEPLFGRPGDRKRLLFTPRLPAGGFSLFHVVDRLDTSDVGSCSHDESLTVSTAEMQNAAYNLRIDPATGTISSLVDRRIGLELLRQDADTNAGSLLVIRDLSDTWGAGVERFDDVIGVFKPTDVRVLEEGPLRVRVEVRLEYGRSTAVHTIDLYRDLEYIDFHLEVHWHESLACLKVAFPFALDRTRSWYEIPYGAIERPVSGSEEPMQKWVQIIGVPTSSPEAAGWQAGFVVDNIGGADVLNSPERGTDLRMTVLRSPFYGYLSPDGVDPEAHRPVSDQGVRRVRYRFIAGPADSDLRIPEHAHSMGDPLQAVVEGSYRGPVRKTVSYIACSPDTVHLSALKPAEDGDGFVVRLVETRGIDTETVVTGPGGFPELHTVLGPYEIQSWRWRRNSPCERCNLLEDPI